MYGGFFAFPPVTKKRWSATANHLFICQTILKIFRYEAAKPAPGGIFLIECLVTFNSSANRIDQRIFVGIHHRPNFSFQFGH